MSSVLNRGVLGLGLLSTLKSQREEADGFGGLVGGLVVRPEGSGGEEGHGGQHRKEAHACGVAWVCVFTARGVCGEDG